MWFKIPGDVKDRIKGGMVLGMNIIICDIILTIQAVKEVFLAPFGRF